MSFGVDTMGFGWRGLLAVATTAAMLVCASPAAGDPARVIAAQHQGPRVIKLTISTPAFAQPTHVDVDLPVGYTREPRRRWPVTYVLAGEMNTYASFNSVVDGVSLSRSYPSIIVAPNPDSGWWSDWYNGGAFGSPMYETFVIDQLIPLIDKDYRTIPRRSARAVMGVSMGGYGAMMFAAQHPDLFADAASLSGAVDTNLPYIAGVVTASPEFQGGRPDAIYGPQATEEVRWHGHNPTDLADNLRGVNLEVLTANGFPNPGIGETLLSADSASCLIEQGVQQASISFNNTLDGLRIPHIWRDYGPGCHTPPNFEREITATFRVLDAEFGHPPNPPASFSYMSIEPSFRIWGWHITADRKRALEFMHVNDASARGLTLVGSGATTVTTPPLFRRLRRVGLGNATPAIARPSRDGRITFTVHLGPPDAVQEYTTGADTASVSRTVDFAPYALIDLARIRATAHGLRVCARAIGGTIVARARLLDSNRLPLIRSRRLVLTGRDGCRLMRWMRRPGLGAGALLIRGRDAFGHRTAVRRTIRLTEAAR